jgi:hypothetical protein
MQIHRPAPLISHLIMSEEQSDDIAKQLADLDLECRFRQTKIRQSASMKDVAQLKDVEMRGELRNRAHEISGPKLLENAAEKRMRELLDGHLMELRSQRDIGALGSLRSQFLHREWVFLKAAFPLLYREAEIEGEKLLIRLERETDTKRKRLRGKG